MACYGGGYLVLWAVFAVGTAAAAAELLHNGWFELLEDTVGISESALALLAWLVPNTVLCVGYFGLVARGTAAARYANR